MQRITEAGSAHAGVDVGGTIMPIASCCLYPAGTVGTDAVTIVADATACIVDLPRATACVVKHHTRSVRYN